MTKITYKTAKDIAEPLYLFTKKCQKCYKKYGTDFKTSKLCYPCSNYKNALKSTSQTKTATQGKEEGLEN
jgi:hypothetical protein